MIKVQLGMTVFEVSSVLILNPSSCLAIQGLRLFLLSAFVYLGKRDITV